MGLLLFFILFYYIFFATRILQHAKPPAVSQSIRTFPGTIQLVPLSGRSKQKASTYLPTYLGSLPSVGLGIYNLTVVVHSGERKRERDLQ
ncbi:hypothetical protein F4775DRAFT_556955 [Biscogniauxia sp. FL1348]|nr:hypothetical protein F4775DRAFT_556955 [Biscogniauxia sp. FL1348]